MQIRKKVQHEYMEDELWKFLEKQVLPLLMTRITASETKASNTELTPTKAVLSGYIEELFMSLRGTALSEVC